MYLVNSEWMRSPEVDAPPDHYFCPTKLKVWANTADQVKEACGFTKAIIGRYFDQKHRDVVSQITGKFGFLSREKLSCYVYVMY